MKKFLLWALAMGLTAGLLFVYPRIQTQDEPKGNGLFVLRIWGTEGDVLKWLAQAAAVYEKESGCRVYVRTASEEEVEKAGVLPDGWVGGGEGTMVACRGYGLAVPDAQKFIKTPEPQSGLFLRPTQPLPLSTPEPVVFPEKLSGVAVPEEMKEIWPDGVVAENPVQAIMKGTASAALLTPSQVAQLSQRIHLYPRGDFFLPIYARAYTLEGEKFLAFLRQEKAQRLLTKQKLFSYDSSLILYGPEQDDLFRMEQCRKNFPQ